MVTRDQVLLAVAGFLLFNAEGRLLIRDYALTDTDRHQVGAQLSGLSINTESMWRVSAKLAASHWSRRARAGLGGATPRCLTRWTSRFGRG